MTWFEALVLGLLQGITEFLPVSSSGHLVIGKELFGIETQSVAFEVAVHTATVLSTFTVFRKEITRLLLGCTQPFFRKEAPFIRLGGRLKLPYNEDIRYVLVLLLSMLPVLVVGLFFKGQIETLFGSGLMIVGTMLIVTSLLLLLAQTATGRTTSVADSATSIPSAPAASAFVAVPSGKSLSYKDAFFIGIAQAVAVLPGLSRSGATISTGLLLGNNRAAVAKFSFLMVLIPVLGEAFLDVIKGGFAPQASGIGAGALLIGFVAAFLSGLAACKWMIALVKRAKLWGFAFYCTIVGAGCLLFHIIT